MENNIKLGDGVYTRTDGEGNPDISGGYILFGSYPASRVTDRELISALSLLGGELPRDGECGTWTSYKYYIFNDNSRDFMWYTDVIHGGERYRGVYFTDHRPNETMNMSDENQQEENAYPAGVVYWFLYKRIKWRILGERDGKAWLITDACIDSQAYRSVVWDNSYVRSSVREWLNTEFLNTAFSECERKAIERTLIVNEMEDEDVCDGDIPGSDTRDLIHLLSVYEAAETIASDELSCIGTDYAKCQGIRVDPENGSSFWWLRTPYYSIDSWAHIVCANKFCNFNSDDIGSTDTGIRPALWLAL